MQLKIKSDSIQYHQILTLTRVVADVYFVSTWLSKDELLGGYLFSDSNFSLVSILTSMIYHYTQVQYRMIQSNNKKIG